MNVSQCIRILNGISLLLTSGALAGIRLQNVALNQKATQSSRGNPLGGAGGAVDGNKDLRYDRGSCTSTKEQSDPWWRVDLLEVYKILAVTVTNRDMYVNRLNGAEIWIGNSKEANDTKKIRCAVISHIPSGQTFYFPCGAAEGRYVTVLLPGSQKILSLCEVEVFPVTHAYPLSNVALEGDTRQSSTLSFATASKAVDGRRNSYYSDGFCSHTHENETDPWWRVDLRRAYIISSVKVTNRGDCCAERLDGAEIRIGNSLGNNGNNNTRCATISHIRAGKTNTYHCDGGSMEGRFVNVVLPGERKTLTLCEVEVYGTPAVEPLLNVAFKKPTAQSPSSKYWLSNYWSSNAVSQCRSGFSREGCCSSTYYHVRNPWWRVDLLAVHKVSVVTVNSKRDCCTDQIKGAQIWIGNSTSYSNNQRCGFMSSAAHTFNIGGMKGRYVTVDIPRYAVLSLCDVEVFASLAVPKVIAPTPPPPPPEVRVLHGGRYMTLVGERLWWSDALFFCRRHHGDLLSIRSQEEQSAVELLLSGGGGGPFPLTDYVWVGLRRFIMGDGWFWMSGDPMKFTQWRQDLTPHRSSSPCGGLARGEHLLWEDQPCEELLNFICQSGGDDGAHRVYFHTTMKATP